ncbi:unnamed protein product [Schistosoma rodhaini]|uniref:Calponin-homology (CH) domain-containing protein n=1 Tax=Schistosoma rodhaini TaxID=6188 RepID=A0AA85GG98_9TREM|nr:unnamed protein product [Schistosoma rodhaini]
MTFKWLEDSKCGSEELTRIANNALSLINVEPYIRNIHEITPAFVFDLAVVLFGSDILPRRGRTETECIENFEAIVLKLSEEIGVDLDHIVPEDLMVGEPRALSDFLVLLAAFIAYCRESNLLELRISTCESSFECSGGLISNSKLTSKTKEFLECQLSTSPELPRHSMTCAPMFSTSFHQSGQSIDQSTPVKRTPASFQTRNPYVPLDNVNSLLQKSNLFAVQSDNVKPSYPVASCLSNFLEVHTDTSPPATPNAMNGYLEIVPSNFSDADVLPSLENSLNMQQCMPSSPIDEFKKLKYSGSHLTRSPNKEVYGSRNSVISAESTVLNDQSSISSHMRSSFHEHKVHLSTSSNNINNRSVSSSAELIHKSISDKHDSSSSGRGRSLTVTQTVPFQSNTSPPSSLLELNTFPDSHNTTQNYPIEHNNSHFSRKSLNKLVSNEKTNNSYDSIHTSSILAWNAENIEYNKKMNKNELRDGSLDELTSLLSTSLVSDTDKVSNEVSGHCPTTSDIVAEINEFSCVLEKRLNYLRSVYFRAHSEAEALAGLVQLVTSKSLNIIEPMNNSQLNDNNNNSILKNNPLNVHENHLHLESLLVKAIDRIDQLLEKYITPCSEVIKNSCNSCMDSATYFHPKSKKVDNFSTSKTCFHSKNSISSKFNCLYDDSFSDVQLRKLLDLKHEYMMKAFHLCLDQLRLLNQ